MSTLSLDAPFSAPPVYVKSVPMDPDALSTSTSVSSPSPAPGLFESTAPPPQVETGLFYYGVSLRQLNIAVVSVLIILVVLVLVLTFLKAKRGWFSRNTSAAGQSVDPASLQPVGDRGLLVDNRPGGSRGLNEATIQAVGKVYTYSAPLRPLIDGEKLQEGFTKINEPLREGQVELRTANGLQSALSSEGMIAVKRNKGTEEEIKLTVDEDKEKRGEGAMDLETYGENECTVCLAEYKDSELLKKLTACDHSFHQDCIDAWLRCNTSCPLCRTNLQPKGEAEALISAEELPLSSGGGLDDSHLVDVSHEQRSPTAGNTWPASMRPSADVGTSSREPGLPAEQRSEFVSIPIR